MEGRRKRAEISNFFALEKGELAKNGRHDEDLKWGILSLTELFLLATENETLDRNRGRFKKGEVRTSMSELKRKFSEMELEVINGKDYAAKVIRRESSFLCEHA